MIRATRERVVGGPDATIRAARLRLMAYIVGVLAVVLLATGSVVYGLLTRQLDEAVEEQLNRLSRPGPAVGAFLEGDALPRGTFIVGSFGSRAVRSTSAPAGVPFDAAVVAARASANGTDRRTIELDGERYRVQTTVGGPGRLGGLGGFGGPRGGPGGGGPGGGNGGNGNGLGPGQGAEAVVQVGVSLAERERQQWVIRLALAGGGGLGIALTALGAFFLTGRALAPVEASMARQRRFVSDASHELRTPLALLRLELERQPALEREQRTPLLRQIDRLGRMVEDLLLLARADEGALPLEREPVPVADLLRTAADEARRLAPEALVSTSIGADGGADAWVDGDADRLHQALLVLIDNAARVTPSGESIALEARVDGGAVEIAVIDGGPGVPREHAGQVFERFYRADKARARAQGGAGLGLAIARDIVRAHGGELRLDNPGEAHARFVIRLPALDLAASGALEPAPE